MHCLYLALLKDVTREQSKHQQGNHDEQRPGAEKLLGAGLRGLSYSPSQIQPYDIPVYQAKDTEREGSRSWKSRTIVGIRIIFRGSP